MLRRELLKSAKEEDFEKNFVRSIIDVCKDMGGWSIDYILDMPILRFGEVRDFINWQRLEQKREIDEQRNRTSFR